MRHFGRPASMERIPKNFQVPLPQAHRFQSTSAGAAEANPEQRVGQPLSQPLQAPATARCVCDRRYRSSHAWRINKASRYPFRSRQTFSPSNLAPAFAALSTGGGEGNYGTWDTTSDKTGRGIATWRKPKTGTELKAEALANAPEPDEDYLRQAFNTPFATGSRQKLLVILDLNGTVLARPSREKKKHFVKRPFVDEFVAALLAEHRVMVWSSAQPDSVRHMVDGLVADEAQRAQLVAVWNRQHLQLAPDAYRQKVQVYKRLTWVWDDEAVQSSHPRAADGHFWDQTNTVLVDDSFLKASSEPYNHIEIPEFVEIMRAQETQNPVLKELLAYIEEASYFEDVSTFIRRHPFRAPT